MQKAKKNEKEKEWITMPPAQKKRETLPLFLRHKKSGSLVS